MTQQLTITTESPERVKPLLQAAILDQVKLLEHGIARTRERLAEFEKRNDMTSAEFEGRFNGQDLRETLDYLDWWMEIKALHMLEEDYQALSEAHID